MKRKKSRLKTEYTAACSFCLDMRRAIYLPPDRQMNEPMNLSRHII